MPHPTNLVIHGWTIFLHPLMLDAIDQLIANVETLKEKHPQTFTQKNDTKRLAAITKLMLDTIPLDPTKPEYRQGGTLGDEHKHWFRAKFFQQYRLFFRFDSASKIIVFAWVNDAKNKRAYGSKSDAYRVFGKMLTNGHPPGDWNELLNDAKGALDRLNTTTETLLR